MTISKIVVPVYHAVEDDSVPLKPLSQLLKPYMVVLRCTGVYVAEDSSKIGDENSTGFLGNFTRFHFCSLLVLLGHFAFACWQIYRIFFGLDANVDFEDMTWGFIGPLLNAFWSLGVLVNISLIFFASFCVRGIVGFRLLWSKLRFSKSQAEQVESYARRQMLVYAISMAIMHLVIISVGALEVAHVGSVPWLFLLDSLHYLVGGFYLAFLVVISELLAKLFSVYHDQLTIGQAQASTEDRNAWRRVDRFLVNFFATAEAVQLYNSPFCYCIGFHVSVGAYCTICVIFATISYGYQEGAFLLACLTYQIVVCFILLCVPVKLNEEANKSFPTSCKACLCDIAPNQQIKLLALQNFLNNSPVGFTFFSFRLVNSALLSTFVGLYATGLCIALRRVQGNATDPLDLLDELENSID